MRRLLALTATVTALAAGVAAAPSANADSQNHTDPRGDTTLLQPQVARAPAAKSVDITRVHASYQGTKVKVVLTVADLGAAPSDSVMQYVARARSGQEDWLFGIIKIGHQVQPLLQPTDLKRPGTLLRPSAGRGIEDCAPKYDLDKKADTVTLVATRDCLGAGASVRIGAVAAVMVGDDGGFRADDARRKGRVSSSAADIKLGPAVDRN